MQMKGFRRSWKSGRRFGKIGEREGTKGKNQLFMNEINLGEVFY